MRRICDLLKEDRVLWIYLRNPEARERFAAEVNQLGAAYANGQPVTPESCTHIMTLHADLKVYHLMIRIWQASFEPDFQSRYWGDASRILRVDYANYAAGEPDFLCTQSGFKPVFEQVGKMTNWRIIL